MTTFQDPPPQSRRAARERERALETQTGVNYLAPTEPPADAAPSGDAEHAPGDDHHEETRRSGRRASFSPGAEFDDRPVEGRHAPEASRPEAPAPTLPPANADGSAPRPMTRREARLLQQRAEAATGATPLVEPAAPAGTPDQLSEALRSAPAATEQTHDADASPATPAAEAPRDEDVQAEPADASAAPGEDVVRATAEAEPTATDGDRDASAAHDENDASISPIASSAYSWSLPAAPPAEPVRNPWSVPSESSPASDTPSDAVPSSAPRASFDPRPSAESGSVTDAEPESTADDAARLFSLDDEPETAKPAPWPFAGMMGNPDRAADESSDDDAVVDAVIVDAVVEPEEIEPADEDVADEEPAKAEAVPAPVSASDPIAARPTTIDPIVVDAEIVEDTEGDAPSSSPVTMLTPPPSPAPTARPAASAAPGAPLKPSPWAEPVLQPKPVQPAPEPLAPQFIEPQVSRESYTPPVNHWSRMAEMDDETQPHENTLSREVGGSNLTTATSALILPSIPQSDFSSVINGTGEILVTGTIALPESLSTMGGDGRKLDHPDVDRMLEAFDAEGVTNDSAPVRAIRAVSTHTSTNSIIVQPQKQRGNRLLAIAMIATGVLVLATVGLLAVYILTMP